jgi:hypothetical protein
LLALTECIFNNSREDWNSLNVAVEALGKIYGQSISRFGGIKGAVDTEAGMSVFMNALEKSDIIERDDDLYRFTTSGEEMLSLTISFEDRFFGRPTSI